MDGIEFLCRKVLGVITFSVFSLCAYADLGPLKDVVDSGYSDGWNAKLDGDSYWLKNESNQGAIRYYYTAYNGDGGKRTISANVLIQTQDANAQAGLIYGFDERARSYYLITLSADGTVNIVRRDASGFNTLMSSSTDANEGEFNELKIKENGNEIEIFVNGRSVSAIGNNTVGKGNVGIVAVGTGLFGFADYQEQSPQSAQRQVNANAAPANQQASRPNTSRALKTFVIRDEFGFEQPMEALTVKMPDNWDVKGSVQWYGKPSCTMDVSMPKYHLKATAPDGKKWVEFMPGGVWGWNSNFDVMPQMAQQGMSGCDARRILDAQTFANQYIPTLRPDARIQSVRQRPDAVQKYMAMPEADIMSFRQQYPNMRLRPDGAEVNLSYQANGHTINEKLFVFVLFIDMPSVDYQGGMNAQITVAMAMGTMITATVDGQAEEAMFEMLGKNMQPNKAYEQRVRSLVNQRTAQMRQAHMRQMEANRRFRASINQSNNSSSIAKTNSDILDIQMDGYTKRQNIIDSGQSRSVDMIHERKPWQNTYGQTIYMPQQYQRVYQLPNDVYAGTHDAFFNPTYGTQLQPGEY